MGLSRLGTAPSTANQGSTLSPSPAAGTLTQNAGQPVSSMPFADDFGDGTVINNNQDGGFFSLLSGATRDLDTAENTLTEAAGAVSNISEDFTHPSERRGGFGKGGRSAGAYNTGGLVRLQEGGDLGSAFSQGFQQGTLQPMVSTPIPPTADPYGSAAGLSALMRDDVYTGVNAYNQGTPVGPPVNTQMLQTAQNFANPSVFSYNNTNQGSGGLSGMMPSGAPGSMNPMAGMQNQGMGAQPQQQQQMMPVQPYTMGT